MPDFNFAPLALQPQQQTSLGDMLNIARGAQAYQQAQQINPLLQEKAQLDIQAGQQGLQKGSFELQQANRINEEIKRKQQFFSNPENYLTNDGKIDLIKLNETLPKIAPLTSGEDITKYSTLYNNQSEAETAKRNLTKNKKDVFGSALGSLGYAGIQDPKVYADAIKRIAGQYPEDNEVQRLAKSYISTLGYTAPGPHVSATAIKLEQELLTPSEVQEKLSPTAGVQDVGGNIISTVTSKGAGGTTPRVTNAGVISGKSLTPGLTNVNGITGTYNSSGEFVPLSVESSGGGLGGGGSEMQTNAPETANKPSVEQKINVETKPTQPAGNLKSQFVNKQVTATPLVKDLYNVPKNALQLTTQQKDLYDKGNALYDTSSKLATQASDSKQTIRQIQNNISEAAGGKPGQILRNAGKWVAGNEKLDILIKSLADNQQRQAQLMGVDTVHGQQVSATANGSEDITAGALKSITERADATNTAFTKFQQGYDKFVKSRGDLGGKVNYQAFQQEWANNYDPRIFMVQNINESNFPKAQKDQEIRKILGSLTDNQLEELQRKSRNIKRLERGDF